MYDSALRLNVGVVPQVLVRGFKAMNSQMNARGTQDMQLPVLPDPEMNHRLTQQQQQHQQEVPTATKAAAAATQAAAAVAGVVDNSVVQGDAQTVQQAVENVATTATDATNAVAAQVNAAATS